MSDGRNRVAELEAQLQDARTETERLRCALREIAAYTDTLANEHLEKCGSYGAFDEPGSVEIARRAIGEQDGFSN